MVALRLRFSRSPLFAGALMLVLLPLAGCSSSRTDEPRASFRGNAPALHVEVESSEQEFLRRLQSQPTDFELNYPEASYAWERARAFFAEYTSSSSVEPLESTPLGKKPSASKEAGVIGYDSQAALISNRLASQDAFIFEVRRSTGKKGARFSISVRSRPGKPPASTQSLKLQAQNLAHFVRSGMLDATITPPARKS